MLYPESAIFVLPHQDDEMLIYHRIRALLRQGTRVHLIWVTDGAANNEEVRQMLFVRLFVPLLAQETDEAIRRIRADESSSLAKALGMPRENLHFLAFPSGQIQRCFSEIIAALASLFHALTPDEVYTVAFEHGEFEHDVVNAAVRLAARQAGAAFRLYEFPVFHRHRGKLRFHQFIPWEGIPVERTPFSRAAEQERIRLFLEHFPSQWFVARLEQLFNLFPSEFKQLGEPYRQMPAYDFRHPLEDTQLMYQPKSLNFQVFREMVLPYLGA
jgi:LmbE family N-acetylglucosaminyl deacetylase